MKKESSKSPSKAVQQEEDRWIDIHNDDIVRDMGLLRPFPQSPRDKSVWTKTPYERQLLKRIRHSFKGDLHFHTSPRKSMRFRCRLIINLQKNKYFSKTTYSTECWQHEIPDILSKYCIVNNKTGNRTNVVRKYSWNGKTYSPKDLPFGG